MTFRVLVACEFSGTVRDAFIANGFDAWSCDLLPTTRPGPHIKGDVIDVLDRGWDLMIAHPPCTYLTVSGNRWFVENPDRYLLRLAAAEFFFKLALANIPHIAVENPVGVMGGFYRTPDQIVQPYEYGHDASKKTCLWLKNLPPLKPTCIVPYTNYHISPRGVKMDAAYSNAGKNRALKRSVTFQGIASAMAEQWGNWLRYDV